MEKVIVIGSPGAGKSTFARKLRDKTGLPLYYLDMLYHNPDKTTVSRDEFDARLTEIMESDQWIVDGNYQRTIPLRFKKCDTIFFFDVPLEECLEGATARIGTKREDMPWVEEVFDEEFKQYIIDFPKDQLPLIYDLISKHENDKEIIVFKSRTEADDWLK